MCSIGEEDFGDEGGRHVMPPDVLEDKPQVSCEAGSGSCSKCSQCMETTYKLRFRAPECKDCFLKYVRHKFRAPLGSSKILPKGAKVLVVFDGSKESLVLVDMMYHSQTLDNFRRLHCSAILLYIDDYHLRPDFLENSINSEEHLNHLNKIQYALHHYPKFENYIIPLLDEDKAGEMINLSQIYINRIAKESNDNTSGHWESFKSFRKQLYSIKSSTSRRDFIRHQRHKLLALVGKLHQCRFVFMPDIATTLASNLLTAIALGRGSSAALDVSLLDDRYKECRDIQFVRPFKELNRDEIDLYIKACSLEDRLLSTRQSSSSEGCDERPTYEQDDGSIQLLTQRFVDDLQANFSATVSTVSRTGDKLKANHETDKCHERSPTSSKCVFCSSILDCGKSDTLRAIEYSTKMSNQLDHQRGFIENALEGKSSTKQDNQLMLLCYGCRNIYNECPDKTMLTKMITNKR